MHPGDGMGGQGIFSRKPAVMESSGRTTDLCDTSGRKDRGCFHIFLNLSMEQ